MLHCWCLGDACALAAYSWGGYGLGVARDLGLMSDRLTAQAYGCERAEKSKRVRKAELDHYSAPVIHERAYQGHGQSLIDVPQ